MFRHLLIFTTSLLLAGKSSNAEVLSSSETLSKISKIAVVLIDNVVEGCLLNPSHIESKIKNSFAQNSISIDNSSPYVLTIEYAGFSTSTGSNNKTCVLSYEIGLYTHLGQLGVLAMSKSGGVIAGPGNLDKKTLLETENATNKVISAMVRSKINNFNH